MERAEAEAIYDQGREVVVEVLLRMDRQIQALTERVVRQDERIAQLERRLNRSSRNSSSPPSSDQPGETPKRGKDPSGRGQGAQPGHEGKGRPLLPAWAVDEVVEHWPERCACGHAFAARERSPVGEPARWQIEELPVISVSVTEHRCQRLRCPECGKRTPGALPDEVAHSAFGPRLQAAVATLSVRNRISRRDVVELCEQLFSSRISSGTVDAILERAAQALSEPHADLLERLRNSKALNMDETGWRTAGERRALWGVFDARHAYLHIAGDRVVEQRRALGFAPPGKAHGMAAVDVERLAPGFGVGAHHRVLGLVDRTGIGARRVAQPVLAGIAGVCLGRGIDRREPVKPAPQARRQRLVGPVHIGEDRVAAIGRDLARQQHRAHRRFRCPGR